MQGMRKAWSLRGLCGLGWIEDWIEVSVGHIEDSVEHLYLNICKKRTGSTWNVAGMVGR